jgi:thymidylate synthase (FAD)
MTVNLISITPDAEKTMAHIARVSNPDNQDNPNYAGLLKYCIKHNHWSVFEQSQRYAKSNQLGEIELPELRRQDKKNRQNSIDDLDAKVVDKLNRQMITLFSSSQALYNQMIEEGVAKECARMVLPLCTPTKIYMTGSCRSWIHYINLRSAHGTQKEHMVIAEGCRKVFTEQFPSVSEALEWV